MAGFDIPSFIFGGATGIPNAKELEARRMQQIYAAARQRSPFPKTLGEGLTYMGEAVGENLRERRLREDEQAAMGRKRGLIEANPLPGTGPQAALDPAVNAQRNNLTALLTPGGPGGAAENPTEAAGDTSPQATTLPPGGPQDDLGNARIAAIGGIESGGRRDPYRTVGIPTKYGPALGKYGVVAANVGPWSKEILGTELTPQDFLANNDAQDMIARVKMNQYANKYGEEGAARAWYGGPGNINNVNATDAFQRLTVGGYGQDYLSRLRGQARGAPTAALYPSGTMSDAAPIGVPAGAPVLADENPVTPTDIKAGPTMLAQVGGAAPRPRPAGAPAAAAAPLGIIPSPTAPRQPEPAVPEVFQRPNIKPPAPKMDTGLTEWEKRGHALRQQAYGDQDVLDQAKALIDYGAGIRKADYDRRVEDYKADLARYEASAAKREEYQVTKTKEDLERGLSLSKDSFAKVENIPASQIAIQNVKQLLDQNPKMFTGLGADLKMDVARLAGFFGKTVDPSVDATQSFKAFIAPIMSQLRSAVVGAGAQSEKELATLQQAAGADFKLEPGAIRNILSAVERLNVIAASQHHSRLLTNSGDNPNARSWIFGNYALPMHDILPQPIVEVLRRKVGAADSPEAKAKEMEYFNRKYNTPGLAQKMLEYRN